MFHTYDAYYADGTLEELRDRERWGEASDEPIRTPAILNWIAVVSIACCILLAVIQALI